MSANDSKENRQLQVVETAMPLATKNGHATASGVEETHWAAQESLNNVEGCNFSAPEHNTAHWSSDALYAHLLQFKFPPGVNEDTQYTFQGFTNFDQVATGTEGAHQFSDGTEIGRGYAAPVLMGYDTAGRTVWTTQFYPAQPYLPCSDCGFFECPNSTGECECPYATVYEISGRYDYGAGYGYERLPRSSNPNGWTFENTGGCRLYGLGLKSLAPMKPTETAEKMCLD
ncbi:hypothetical protein B0H16DRAFT_1715621 [Mycena metata]|uniref:Uncharacterized protein n=1 Tax=Mycena metata TaxID=1033252 RepID=A0AAD7NPA2_9AGAR|nr:hypothetical protein B0H16DRAFT_1715621 [Mycena metata]